MKEKVQLFVEKNSFQTFIIVLIIFNSITIGMEFSEQIMNSFGEILLLINKIILSIFVIEILLKLYVYDFVFLKVAGMFLILQ